MLLTDFAVVDLRCVIILPVFVDLITESFILCLRLVRLLDQLTASFLLTYHEN